MVDLDAGDLESPMLNSRYNLVKRRVLRALFEAPLSSRLLQLLSTIVAFFSMLSPPLSSVLIVRTSLVSDYRVSSLTCSSLTPVLKIEPIDCCL